MRMEPNQIIDALGGTSEVARLCGIKPPSVSEWRRDGIPWPWLLFFSRERPDVVRPDIVEQMRIAKLEGA